MYSKRDSRFKPSTLPTKSYKLCEQKVSKRLRSLDSTKYKVFDNLVLPFRWSSFGYAEIDHLVISPHGIWCVETKSNRGSILKRTHFNDWKINFAGRDYDFYSPEKQNNWHIKVLSHTLGLDDDKLVVGIVVMPYADRVLLDYEEVDLSIENALSTIISKNKPVFSDENYEMILQTLEHFDQIKHENKKRHKAAFEARSLAISRV